MNSLIKIIISLAITKLLLGNVEIGYAQASQQKIDSTKTSIKADTLQTSNEQANFEDEIELLEINIEAVIEKPRVAILPKRVEPQLGEMEFINRSFEGELKKAPDKPMVMDNRLFAPQKIENLKQKLIERKKKLDKK